MASQDDAEDIAWAKRYDAVGNFQRRYLFLLLLFSVFFLALEQKLKTAGDTIELPLIAVPFDATPIWYIAPAILLVLLLAYQGSLHAARRAKLKSNKQPIEPFDYHPTVIDMVVYSREESEWPRNMIQVFSYPVVLIAFLVVAWVLEAVVLGVLAGEGRWGWFIGSFLTTAGPTGFSIVRLKTMIAERINDAVGKSR